MKFIYIGTGAETDAFGLVFPKGQPVEVEEAYAVKKLSGNPQFKVAEEAPKRATVADLLPIIAEADAATLARLSEGEERVMVLRAIEDRTKALAEALAEAE